MAVKACAKEKGYHKRTQGPLSDEIALRDEILELKRQVVRLKRTNEQNMVKFRKYEDEAKRKDRQIEQLMDPRKNADVTKILSTKGAAILMNLKDQNNSLIQVILNKDLQIRKLVSEIKMSKLYASSKKNESFRTEVNRLRNLLIRSQELLKENVNQSVCISENPLLEISSPSEQSSPRDLDELRCTIQSLEMHIKYSNELLAKKNEEISVLTSELNTLRKFFNCKATKKKSKKVFECDCDEFFDRHEFPTNQWQTEDIPQPTTSQEVLELFEKTRIDERPIPNSAPTISTKWIPSRESTPKHASLTNISWNKGTKKDEAEKSEKNEDWEKREEIPSIQNPLVNDHDAGEILKGGKMVSRRPKPGVKEKWKKALAKCKQFQAENSGNVGAPNQEKSYRGKIMKRNDTSSDVSDIETHEFEMMEKEIQNDQTESGNSEKIVYWSATETGLERQNPKGHAELDNFYETEAISLQCYVENQQVDDDPKLNSCQIPANLISTEHSEGVTIETVELDPNDEMQQIKKEIHKMTPEFSPDVQVHLVNLYENISNYQQLEKKRATTTLRETYRQSLDSSFESDNNFSVKELQVEVEINSAPNDTSSETSPPSENPPRLEFHKENGENCIEDDFNDDDDVIVR